MTWEVRHSMWIAIGILIAWCVLSLPLGIIVGKALARANRRKPQYCHPSFGCDCDGNCQ